VKEASFNSEEEPSENFIQVREDEAYPQKHVSEKPSGKSTQLGKLIMNRNSY
jgi:hypothetical protein